MRHFLLGFEIGSALVAIVAVAAGNYPCGVANIAIAAYMRYARVAK